MRAKKGADELLEWMQSSGMEEELSGKVGMLRAVMRGLMVAGSKSFTHMLIALERYDSLLKGLLDDTGERVCFGAYSQIASSLLPSLLLADAYIIISITQKFAQFVVRKAERPDFHHCSYCLTYH